MKHNHYKQILSILSKLKVSHPSYNLGKHIATALSDYPDIWGVSDIAFLQALQDYQQELNLDVKHKDNEEEIQKIIKEGMHLNSFDLLEEE